MTLPRNFYFLRHGQTDWNVEHRLQGRTDIPLNATGHRQAAEAAALLENTRLDHIITSPLLRASQTAETIAAHHGLPLHTMTDLQERSFGSFEGRYVAEIMQENQAPPKAFLSPFLPDDAESWPDLQQRALTVLHTILTERDGTVLVVSHGAFFKALYQSLSETLMEAENATPYHFERLPNGLWQVSSLKTG